VQSVLTYRDLDDAIRIANATDYGRSAGTGYPLECAGVGLCRAEWSVTGLGWSS
jgi:hypothetical protein